MSPKIIKLENPERIRELNPEATLKRIGVGEKDVICDIGAGSGIFTVTAAKITNNLCLALETDDEMLEFIAQKAKNEKLSNVKTVKVSGPRFDIEDNTVDLVILVTVLHEVENKGALLAEIKRILKSDGRLAIIEFRKLQTPMGPPVMHRISQDEIIKLCDEVGLSKADEFGLGDNFYAMVLSAK